MIEVTLTRALAEVGRAISVHSSWGDYSDHSLKAIKMARGELDCAIRQCQELRRGRREADQRQKKEDRAARQKQAEANGWGKMKGGAS